MRKDINAFMMMVVVLLITLSFAHKGFAGQYQVTFKTTECNGDSGYATVEIDKIHKIETITCDEPDSVFKKLNLVIVKSAILPNSFDIFTITGKEAKRIKHEIESYMKAKKSLLKRGKPLILLEED